MSARIAVMTGSLIIVSTLSAALAAQTAPPSQGTSGTQPGRQGTTTRPADLQKADAKASPDSSFIIEAAAGGMKEVELGKLAQSHASDSNVKAFGLRMVTDHGKANKELMSLAKAKGVTLPPSHPETTTAAANRPGATGATGTSGVGGAHASGDADQLSVLKGAEFDRAYMADMVEDHEKDVKAFEQEAQSGQDPEVKAWAARQLPILREHLSQAKAVHDRLTTGK